MLISEILFHARSNNLAVVAFDNDVSAVRPHLGSSITIESKAKHVLARCNQRHFDDVQHRRSLPKTVVIAGLVKRIGRARGWVAAAAAVAAGRFGAGQASTRRAVTWRGASVLLFTLLAAAIEVSWMVVIVHVTLAPRPESMCSNWIPRPCCTWWRCAHVHKGALDREPGPICEEQRLLVANKVEVLRLKTLLCQCLAGRTQPVRIASSVVEPHRHDDLCLTTGLPDSASWHFRQVRPTHAMLGMRGVQVAPLLWGVCTPWRATSQATRIRYWSIARRPPWVVAKDVVRRITSDTAIDGDGIMRKLANEALLAQVCLAPTTDMVALVAADEATLAVPK